MATQLTVTIPDAIYRHVLQSAQEKQQPVAKVISDAIAQFFPTVAVSPERENMENEERAFQEAKPSLLLKYNGQYVAMFQREVVDFDDDQVALVKRLNQSYANETVLVKLVTPQSDRIIRVRSPRFI